MKKNQLLVVLNTFEGLKTAAKEAHWVSKNLNYHKLVGDVYDELSSVEDDFAEACMVLVDSINVGDIQPISVSSETVIEASNQFAIGLKELVSSEGPEFAGVVALVDDFVQSTTKFLYLKGLE